MKKIDKNYLAFNNKKITDISTSFLIDSTYSIKTCYSHYCVLVLFDYCNNIYDL